MSDPSTILAAYRRLCAEHEHVAGRLTGKDRADLVRIVASRLRMSAAEVQRVVQEAPR